jgi:hypothetical protein
MSELKDGKPVNVQFNDFIGVYTNFFTDGNIDQFFEYWEHAERISPPIITSRVDSEGSHLFEKADNALGLNSVRYEPSLKHLNADFDDFLKYLNTEILEPYNQKYPGFGRPLAIEGKMQKTQPGEGYHVWHSELDPAASKRVLAWAFFLNDVEEGGELEFLHQNMRIKPKRGDFVVWPANFTHIHRGNPPLSGDKYIVTGWYQYVNHNHIVDDD